MGSVEEWCMADDMCRVLGLLLVDESSEVAEVCLIEESCTMDDLCGRFEVCRIEEKCGACGLCFLNELCAVNDMCEVGEECVVVETWALDEMCLVMRMFLVIDEGLGKTDELCMLVGAPLVKFAPNSRNRRRRNCMTSLVVQLLVYSCSGGGWRSYQLRNRKALSVICFGLVVLPLHIPRSKMAAYLAWQRCIPARITFLVRNSLQLKR